MDDDAQQLAEAAAAAMLSRDHVFADLGIELVDVAPGRGTVAMTVRREMTNGHALCHGGYLFLLADEALAVACNSYDDVTVAASGAIEFLAPAREGERVTATVTEVVRSGRRGVYDGVVTNPEGTVLATFHGVSARVSGTNTKAPV
jgi:acyl-CoA thioesterase